MSTALAPVQYKPTDLSTESLGAVLVKSGYFADTRDVAQAIVKVLAGRELGFGPIASMQGVYIVKGRVTLSANLVGAAIQRSGKYTYAVKELTNDRCTLVFRTTLVGGGTFESTFTIQDAQQAGIAGDTYKKFPRNMLFSRALTNGARWFCPEVFNGPIYTPDELGAIVEGDGRVVESIPGTQRAEFPTLEELAEDAPLVDRTTGEVLEQQTPRDAAIAEWVLASDEATRLGIKHKELPANAGTPEQIERWAEMLRQKIAEHGGVVAA